MSLTAEGSNVLLRLLYASNVNTTNANKIIADAAAAGRSALSEIESKKILEAIGIPSAIAERAATADDAVLIAARIGFPVVLKVLSPEVTHKSEVGGVELNLHSAAEVRDRVLDEVRRAARLIDTGLWSFGMVVQGNNGREQLKAAAEAANEARKQVVTAIKQARGAWRQVVAEAHRHEESRGHTPRSSRKRT